MQPDDYLCDILPVEMRSVVRSFIEPIDRIRLACTCKLLAAEDAAFVTLPPVLAAYASDYPAMDNSTRASMRIFFLDLLSARHLPVMAWVFSLANGVAVSEKENSWFARFNEITCEEDRVDVMVTEFQVEIQCLDKHCYVILSQMYDGYGGDVFYSVYENNDGIVRPDYYDPDIYSNAIFDFISLVQRRHHIMMLDQLVLSGFLLK